MILIAILAVLSVVGLLLPGLVPPRSITQTLIWVVLVVGLYTFTGLSGVVSFGQTVFSTIAAYCAAWLTLNPFIKASSMSGLPHFLQATTLSPLTSAVISVVVALVAGFVVSLAVTRLKGEAATIATFALLIMINSIYGNWSSVTGGTSSIVGIPLAVGLKSAFCAAAFAVLLAFAFQFSRIGVMLQASRDDEIAARASGVNVRICRIVAFTLSCGLMGLGGVLQAHFLGIISVDTFYLGTTFMTLAMLVVGGRNSLTGAVLGALLLSLATSGLRALEHGASFGSLVIQIPSGVQEVALGAVMLIVLIKRRRGLCGLWEIGFSGQEKFEDKSLPVSAPNFVKPNSQGD